MKEHRLGISFTLGQRLEQGPNGRFTAWWSAPARGHVEAFEVGERTAHTFVMLGLRSGAADLLVAPAAVSLVPFLPGGPPLPFRRHMVERGETIVLDLMVSDDAARRDLVEGRQIQLRPQGLLRFIEHEKGDGDEA